MKSPEQFQRHNKIIGKILIVVSLLHLVFSAFMYNAVYFFDSWEIFSDIHIGGLTFRHPAALMYAFPFFYVGLAIIEFILAAGILANQKWAQKALMAPAVFYFFNFPLGTAFCIYIFLTFWETPTAAEMEVGQKAEENS